MSKRKILAIQGSFRNNGITSSMLDRACEEAEKAGHYVERIRLHDCNISFCKGCRKCFETGECVFKNDDMVRIAESIKKADVIILASPVYWANVPAIVKNLFDRMSGTSMEETKTFPKAETFGQEIYPSDFVQYPHAFCGDLRSDYRVKKSGERVFQNLGYILHRDCRLRQFRKIQKSPESQAR